MLINCFVLYRDVFLILSQPWYTDADINREVNVLKTNLSLMQQNLTAPETKQAQFKMV